LGAVAPMGGKKYDNRTMPEEGKFYEFYTEVFVFILGLQSCYKELAKLF
jgi:hypothetical protein